MKQLSASIIAGVSADQRRRIERIDAEDFSLVACKTVEDLAATGVQITPEYVERGIFALKQYYAVALLDPANAHAIAAPIDPFWHAHILFTAEYRRFCDDVVGEYMDHVPLDRQDASKVANVRQLYAYTLQVLPKLFRNIDLAFWPVQVSDTELICFHKGNQIMYGAVQRDRLFDPAPEGNAWAYAA